MHFYTLYLFTLFIAPLPLFVRTDHNSIVQNTVDIINNFLLQGHKERGNGRGGRLFLRLGGRRGGGEGGGRGGTGGGGGGRGHGRGGRG